MSEDSDNKANRFKEIPRPARGNARGKCEYNRQFGRRESLRAAAGGFGVQVAALRATVVEAMPLHIVLFKETQY